MATTTSIIPKHVLERLLDVEKLKYCYECGVCTGSCPVRELLGNGYNPRKLLENILSDPEGILSSEELWLCAWCYNCYKRCNQALKLPEVFLLLRKTAMDLGHAKPSEKAIQRIAENIPLPLVTTLVCFHPERAGLEIERVLEKTAKIYEEYLKKEKARRAQEVFEERIAVIGSGPAGLTVAYELSRKGYGITVFEALPQAGGMLRKGIPRHRLPERFLEKEIQIIKDLGVEVKTGLAIGEDMSFSGLWREGYRAIFIGAGAHKSLGLKVDGADLKGVVNALEFLWAANSGERVEVGKNVVVIGGGNVAMDAANTALKEGAKTVTILYRRSKDEMPAIPWEVRETEDAGVKMEFLVSPKKIMGEGGQVCAIECVRMQLGEADESGRKKANPIIGSEFLRDADMVILATGETPDVGFLPKEIELNDDGTIWINPVTMETSVQGVYAGGDVATGPASVIEAIRAGKCAAESIESYLKRPK